MKYQSRDFIDGRWTRWTDTAAGNVVALALSEGRQKVTFHFASSRFYGAATKTQWRQV